MGNVPFYSPEGWREALLSVLACFSQKIIVMLKSGALWAKGRRRGRIIDLQDGQVIFFNSEFCTCSTARQPVRVAVLIDPHQCPLMRARERSALPLGELNTPCYCRRCSTGCTDYASLLNHNVPLGPLADGDPDSYLDGIYVSRVLPEELTDNHRYYAAGHQGDVYATKRKLRCMGFNAEKTPTTRGALVCAAAGISRSNTRSTSSVRTRSERGRMPTQSSG